MQITNCRTTNLNFSGSGDTTVIAAPGGTGSNPGTTQAVGGTQVGCITVWGVQIEGAGATVINFKSGTTVIGGPITFTGAGSTATLIPCGVPWYKAAAGQALVMNLGTGVAITGVLYYTLG